MIKYALIAMKKVQKERQQIIENWAYFHPNSWCPRYAPYWK